MPRIDNGHSPASDSIRPSTWPWGTLALFLTSVTCGILQHFDKAGKIAELLGFHFERIRHPFAVAHEQPLPAIIQSVTYVFPHGGWSHLIPNATALFVFGAMAEKRLGTWRLLILYFASGAIGIICQAFVPPLPTSPVAGASLAISGLLGANLALSCTDRLCSATYRNALVPLEVLAVIGMAAWISVRTPPLHADRATSLLYHLLPMIVMWLIVRCYLAVSCALKNAANKAVNPSGGTGGS